MSGKSSIEWTDATWLAALKRVEHARATIELRPILTAVLIRAVGHKLLVVTGDNYRLAEAEIRLFEPVEDPQSGLIPAHGLPLLRAFLTENRRGMGAAGAVSLKVADRLITANVKDTTVSFREMDGMFPDYEAAIFGDKFAAAVGRIGFTGDYLADALVTAGKLGATTVRFSGSLEPVYLVAPGYRECIMPVRLSDDAAVEATRELARAS